MKKLCFLLALLLLLSGCSESSVQNTTEVPTTKQQPEKPAMVSFDIYAINDLHGRFTDTADQPGVDELTTYLKQAQQNGNTILLSTGDMWQGTSESILTNGFVITEWMNELDFTAMTIGGHEYDWGADWIRKNEELAEFPFLGINVYNRQTDQQEDYCQSSVTVDIDGVQVGIIGAIGNCYNSIAAKHTKDVYFKIGDELTALVREEAEKLRSDGADFIIYAIHDGYDQTYDGTNPIPVSNADIKSYYDTVLSDGYVDLVFEADSHYTYVLLDEQGVYHLQNGGNNSGISHARVLVDTAHNEHHILTAELLPANKYSILEDDPVVAQLLDKYAEQIAPGAQILGTNGQYRNRANICQLVADLYCDAGVEKWGAEYDIVLGGGYISCRSPGYLSAGTVSYSQITALLPFNNEIMLCSIGGKDLLDKFLETENSAYYTKLTPYGESIRDSIDPNSTYYVVTDNYSAEYAYNNMTVIDVYSADIFARDLMADLVATGALS